MLAACGATPPSGPGSDAAPIAEGNVDKLLIVDCLLPPQVRKLGTQLTYLAARRAIKTSAGECEIRGGEYVASDRASVQTALKVWLPDAERGDPVAMNYVGEIYAKGLGAPPDHAKATEWYRRAAEAGSARAQINYAHALERGLGVPKDARLAAQWYQRALEGSGDATRPATPPPAPPKEAPRVTPPSASDGADAILAPPTIHVIEPSMIATRGPAAVTVRGGASRKEIVGKVFAPAGITSFKVNNQERKVEASGTFIADIPLARGSTPVSLAVTDRQGRSTTVEFALISDEGGARPAPTPSVVSTGGERYALVIGNNAYRKLPALDSAVTDARAIGDLLRVKYGYRVTLLTNVNRYQVLTAMNDMLKKLAENDSLVIYYAGHGELDRVNLRGHWLPIDAELDNTANWISSIAITDVLNALAARHVLVIADSCYSGALTRSSLSVFSRGGLNASEEGALLQRLAKSRSRTALTSGGLKPVMDGGGDGHSVFARALIDVLRVNQGPLTGDQIYREVVARVERTARQFGVVQTPEYAPILYAGHEAGDFVLAPSGAGARAQVWAPQRLSALDVERYVSW